MLKELPRPTEIIQCSDCSEVFSNDQRFTSHAKRHIKTPVLPSLNYMWKTAKTEWCDTCDLHFTKRGYAQHVKGMHPFR